MSLAGLQLQSATAFPLPAKKIGRKKEGTSLGRSAKPDKTKKSEKEE